MARNLKMKEWISVINTYKNKGQHKAAEMYCKITGLKLKDKRANFDLRTRIRKKLKLLDNNGMESLIRVKGSGRPKKIDNSDLDDLIDQLTEEQKKIYLKDYFEEQRKKKNKEKNIKINSSVTWIHKAKLFKMDRTWKNKKSKERKYKFNWIKPYVEKIFNDSRKAFGSRRIAIMLEKEHNIIIDDRCLRNYMSRWGFRTVTRVKKKISESKNTGFYCADHCKRNFNPENDDTIASDVSYIEANVDQNNIYLSAAISHKTKLIEGWKLSLVNDTQLVMDTMNQLDRKNFIFHTDHGSQYSSYAIIDKLKEMNATQSMSRVANSLDNREIEYWFGCLKGEYLNHINTSKMSFNEIKGHIEWYINWYNTKRIQSRLNWKTPAEVSNKLSTDVNIN